MPGTEGRRGPVQESLFEEDYLVRTLGALARDPAIALTELVANGWDAGAGQVEIQLPDALDGELVVRDDGCGMTPDEFHERWMMLGYDRTRHQGVSAEFPPRRKSWQRQAYGRNGVGRHGLLCFANRYTVETRKDGAVSSFVVATATRKSPFVLESQSSVSGKGTGTTLRARVIRNLPSSDRIRQVLSVRFVHDPRFKVVVNGRSVPLAELQGLLGQETLEIGDGLIAEAFFVDCARAARTTHHQGVAFWAGGRLVGHPSWTVGERSLIDGRRHFAKRYTFVIRSDDLYDYVERDWSGFIEDSVVKQLFEIVEEYVDRVFRARSSEQVEDTKEVAFRQNLDEIRRLNPLARRELVEFVDDLAEQQPSISPEMLDLAVKAAINLERSRSGAALLEKLSKLADDDVSALDRLLSEWSIRDALTVLDEIDRRLAVVGALEKLSADSSVDELHTLHPLVTEARWLFGPQFDSPEFASNRSLQHAIEKVFKGRVLGLEPEHLRRRPDLVVLKDATVSATATEAISETGLSSMKDVLLIEIKRGRSRVGTNEMNQASSYVDDLFGCGFLDGPPFVHGFVVGHEVAPGVSVRRGGDPERARIEPCSFSQLVRTAEQRLFKLKSSLAERYEQVSGEDLLQRLDRGQLGLYR